MKLESLRTRSDDDCLSDLQLDALAVGALDEAEAERAHGHLASCGRCSERRRALGEATRASAEVLALQPGRGRPPGRAVRPRRAWLGAAVAALSAAAALLVMVGRAPLEPRDVVRSKGAARVGYFVRHAGVVRRGGAREQVSPGDALRFVVTSTAPTYVAVLSRDGAGQVSLYHPSGPRAARVEPGVERPLDASVVLDDVLGQETLYALACSEPVDVATHAEALRRTGAEPEWPAQCSLERFVLIKAAGR